jgi:hypothetical protein
VDKIIDKLQQENLPEGEISKFRIDLVYFLNFLQDLLNKELEQADDLDILRFKEHLMDDYTFIELVDRRIDNVRKGLEILKTLG